MLEVGVRHCLLRLLTFNLLVFDLYNKLTTWDLHSIISYISYGCHGEDVLKEKYMRNNEARKTALAQLGIEPRGTYSKL